MNSHSNNSGMSARNVLKGRATHNMFAIYIPPIDRAYIPLESRVRIQPRLKQIQHEFAKYIAGVIRFEIQRAIETQRYRWNWTPLSKKYVEQKMRKGLSLNIWEATGYLRENITVWRKGETYIVGLRTYARNPIGGRPLYIIAKALEMGVPSKNIPPRPLFRPIFNYVAKNIGRYLSHFLNIYHMSKGR